MSGHDSEIKKQLLILLSKYNPRSIMTDIRYNHNDIYQYLINLKDSHQLSSYIEAIYWIVNDIYSIPKCPNISNKCIKKLRFFDYDRGYAKYCSKCVHSSKERNDARIKTCLEKYGVDHVMKNEDVKNKFKNTCICNYGAENYMATPEFRVQSKNTCMSKYGFDHAMKNDIIKEKFKSSMIEKYGVENSMQHDESKLKSQQTCMIKYGTSTPLKNKEIRLKIKHTNQIRYGCDYPHQNIKVRNKFYNTLKHRYGVSELSHIPHIFDNTNKTQKDYHIRNVNDILKGQHLILLNDYINAATPIKLKCEICNHEFTTIWNYIQQGSRCPFCYPHNRSIAEIEIGEFITSIIPNIDMSVNDRSIISPKELDIYFPDYNLAIEYCGLYWHGNRFNDASTYHINKLDDCNSKNIKLLTIFEDEWKYKKDTIKSKLLYELNIKSSFFKIRASKCEIKIISYSEKHEFLDKYHLQNDRISQINIGLFFKDQLVAVMTFSKIGDNIYELNRLCTKPYYIVYGGMSKMIKYFQCNYEYTQLISYCDRRWSTGNVYDKIGFKLQSITKPNYWYFGKTLGIKRKHRLNYSKGRLKNMDSYDSKLTEFQIMDLEGYQWIYDCGNYKFILE